MAQLTTVGTLTLRALPALEQTGLVAGITSAENITISDTGLTSLSGINVFKLAIFDVNNNKDIDTIDSGLQSVTNLINIAYNAEKVDVTLDELTTANTVYLQSINSFSFANLTTLNDSLTIQQSSIQNIEIKNLTTIGKSLTINDNVDLTDIEFPALTTIGGAFIIEDNTALNSITDFPKLKSVGGSVTVSGDLNNVTFASLNKVSGAFNLTSTGELSCNNFTNANKGLSVAGDTHCNGAKDSSSSSGSGTSSKSSSGTSTASSDSSGSSSSSSKKSDGTTASVSYLTSFMAAFMAVGVALY